MRGEKTNPGMRGALRAVKDAAQTLRQNPTPAEALLWRALRERQAVGLRFRRQHPVGSYVLDFYCLVAKLVVELDGPVHDDDDQRERDDVRTATLNAFGYHVLRFRNEDVYDALPHVLGQIMHAAAEQRALHAAKQEDHQQIQHPSIRTNSDD